MDFINKNLKTEFEMYVEETDKKDSNKQKLINELKEQVDYQLA